MGALRGMAIASNLSFIAYGYLSDIKPVLLLHAALLPVNIFRLVQFLVTRNSIVCDSPCGHPTYHSGDAVASD
jgi:hypothetical protein